MKAALLKATGNISELKNNLSVEDIPLPDINSDEAIVKIKSASINHRDLWITKGLYSKINLPFVPGSDCSGVIHEAGNDVTEFKEGDEVIINPSMNWGADESYQSRNFKILGMPDNGTFAEFIRIHKSYLYKKPSHLNFEQASAIPLAGVTAFRASVKKAKIKNGDNVLITGIGGGVAVFALKFALSAGANVFVTSGDNSKIEKAVLLGAKAGFNYKESDWDKMIMEASENKINVIIDGSGGESYSKLIEICSYGGRIVSYGATYGSADEFSIHRLYWKQLELSGSTAGSPSDFSEMLGYINEKKIIPVIDEQFSLENIHDAFYRMNDSSQFGKIIINIE